jgi:hypothetical protein
VVESNFEKRRALALAFMEALGRVIKRDKLSHVLDALDEYE